MKNTIICFLATGLFLVINSSQLIAQGNSFKPGELWPDNNGVHINAHGGGFLHYNNTYYWFGEHKIEGDAGNYAHVGVHCYSSDDLYNWKDEGIALSVVDDTTSLIVRGCIIERPKVIYNAKTQKFVMWFHHELKGQGYDAALTGLAVANNVTGPYEYIKSLNPHKNVWPVNFPDSMKNAQIPLNNLKSWTPKWKKAATQGAFLQRDFTKGQMARDMTLFVDDDGTAYHIHSSEENQTLHVSQLTDNYLDFANHYARILPGGSNEAPAIFKKEGKYYLIASGCTGWAPNPARLAVADNIFGPWKKLGNPCISEGKETTYQSQSTFILPVQGKKDAFIFMADRWRPENAIDGRYVWLPILFKPDGTPYLEWKSEWSLDDF